MKKTADRIRYGTAAFVKPQTIGSPDPASLFAEALSHHQAGRLSHAEAIYQRILAAQPKHFDSAHLLGVVYLQTGRQQQALRYFDAALKANPRNAAAINNRGIALQELGRLDAALESFERAVGLRPDYAEAHCNRGNILKALGRFEPALASYDRALQLRPDYADAYSNRAHALCELGRFAEALASADRALALRPHFPEAYSNRANALHKLGRFDEALASHDRALALQPDNPESYSNRGTTLHELSRHDDAVASFDRALALRPDLAAAHCNRGNALQELRRFDDALGSYDRAISLKPDFAEALSNRGNALSELHRFEEALASFDRATSLRPNFADAHFNAALCRMLIGDLEGGLAQYEWRWGIDHLKDKRRDFPRPQWNGSDPIAGKTILLHAEQGFGDTIQFCRYVPHVAARGARVILEVPPPLQSLMRSLRGAAQIVAGGEPLPDFDLHCPLLSLPLAFATRLATIPGDTPYLFAAEDRSRAWRDRLGGRRGARIGLVWAGDPRKRLPNANRIDRQRSIEFDHLAPIIETAGCAFYSLQKGGASVAQLRNSSLRHRVIDWTDDLHDFAETAALIGNLDLIIAVDTAVAHLAGALGKPLWLLNRYNTCWRWLLDRSDSPWYPTARLFRQDQSRTWDRVIASAAQALGDYVGAANES